MSADIFTTYRDAVKGALERLAQEGALPAGLDMTHVEVEPPRDTAHGDMATNAALVLAKEAKENPRAIADALAPALQILPGVASAEIAGPGFINLRLDDSVWQDEVAQILKADDTYGEGDIGGGAPVHIEYVSANPTGPMHIGHARGAVVGDALANLLQKAGFKPVREYYVNDAGAQIEALAQSISVRMREALGETDVPQPEGFYPGAYLVPVGEALAKEEGRALLENPTALRTAALDAMMGMIRDDLAALGVRHDQFTHESTLIDDGAIDAAREELARKDLIYEGTLPPPKGKKPEDWSPRPQMLFRATKFGDDTDRPLQKSDGSWTYFASDIAYHRDKLKRGFKDMIVVWGADHAGYAPRMKAAVAALSDKTAQLDVRLCHMVRVLRGGEPVKMSKRGGEFISLRETLDEVGAGALRFTMLTRKSDAPLDFDFDAVKTQAQDNPVFYVQYAHARICSVERKARAEAPNLLTGEGDLTPLTAPAERAVMLMLARFPRAITTAARAREPHRIAFYLHDLAAAFHTLWNAGTDNPDLRFIRPDSEYASIARLKLIRAVRVVLAAGLGILGVQPVDEMR